MSERKHEKLQQGTTGSGWVMLFVLFIILGLSILSIAAAKPLAILFIAAFFFILKGFYTLQPQMAAVLTLFGKYIGSDKREGFRWVNPFMSKLKISLRTRNFNSDKLKVNDKRGNPIEISAVVVWRVKDTYESVFEVEDFEHYVMVQSESALRQLAAAYAYDHAEDDGEDVVTLRSGMQEISESLRLAIQQRLDRAGIEIEEARINHLAYAQEIAQAMLKRQQAEAIISARRKIVEGAVGMVEHALIDLSQKNIVDLDPEQKSRLVSNLLVVLCSETETSPMINAGAM